MKQFRIMIRSFADVQEFVALASAQPFEVTVGDGQAISGKSLMAVLGMSFRHPVLVSVNCDETAFLQFQSAAAKFLA